MLRCFIYSITLVSVMGYPLYAQIDLHFNLKEAIDLPGNAIFDLVVEDINGDDFPDYAYRDSNSVYAIDGIDLVPIVNLPTVPGTAIMRIGDLNADGLKDIALCGTYPDNPDTNFAVFYIAPEYDDFHTLKFPRAFENWAEIPSELYFSHMYGMNLVFLGTRLHRGGGDYYIWWEVAGRIIVYRNVNDQFLQAAAIELGGQLKEIKTFAHNESMFLALRTWGESAAGDDDGPYYWYTWADLFTLDISYETTRIWHAGQMNGFNVGEIGKLLVGQPQPGDNDLLCFYNYSNNPYAESIVCIDDPEGNIAWERSGSYRDYNIALANIQNHEFRDLFIFIGFFQIRNPYDGYLYEIGQVSGYNGTYECVLDQENDGIDEFVYAGTDSIHIYNLGSQTEIFSDYEVNQPQFALLNNYPNPFNSRTIISFELLSPADVKLEIFDILGRFVITLLDASYPVGSYDLSWDAGELKSGIYFAKISIGSYSSTKKMLLVK